MSMKMNQKSRCIKVYIELLSRSETHVYTSQVDGYIRFVPRRVDEPPQYWPVREPVVNNTVVEVCIGI